MLPIPRIFPECQDTLFHKNFATKALPVEDLVAFQPDLGAVSELAKWTRGLIGKTPTDRLFQEVAKLTTKHLNTRYPAESQIKCFFNTVKLYRQIKNPSPKAKASYAKVSEALVKFFRANIQ